MDTPPSVGNPGSIASINNSSAEKSLVFTPRKSLVGSIREFSGRSSNGSQNRKLSGSGFSRGNDEIKRSYSTFGSNKSVSMIQHRRLTGPQPRERAEQQQPDNNVNPTETRKSILQVTPEGILVNTKSNASMLNNQQSVVDQFQSSRHESVSYSRPVSITSLKNIQKQHESTKGSESRIFSQNTSQQPSNSGHEYEYMIRSSRHDSSNFIHKIASSEIVYQAQSVQPKMIGRFLLGGKIGKGAFAKVKEGVCSETLERVAVKIISRKRIKKVPNGVENVLRYITF